MHTRRPKRANLNNRLHELTPALYGRIHSKAQRNVDAACHYDVGGKGNGSGFLVSKIAEDGTGYVLTNRHVALGRHKRASVRFLTSKSMINANVESIVSEDSDTDSALVRIRFYKDRNLAGELEPVRFSNKKIEFESPLYSTGFSEGLPAVDNENKSKFEYKNEVSETKSLLKKTMTRLASLTGHERRHRRLLATRSIQVGFPLKVVWQKVNTLSGKQIRQKLHMLSVPSLPGSSGNLVANEHHDVVGLVIGGNRTRLSRGNWRTGLMPVSKIMEALKKNLKPQFTKEKQRILSILEFDGQWETGG